MNVAVPHNSARRFGPALEALHVFLAWAAPVVEGFPRGVKFTLGDRIAETGLDALERLIEATYDRDRAKPLQGANLAIEKLRHLFRLAFTLHAIDERRYEHAARQLDEIGRLIGAWKKTSAAYDARDGAPT
jgi:hypothetical protein